MTPEQLTEKMARGAVDAYIQRFPDSNVVCFDNLPDSQKQGFLSQSSTMLRIVLQAIKDGEVVSYTEFKNGSKRTILEPDYQTFLDGRKDL